MVMMVMIMIVMMSIAHLIYSGKGSFSMLQSSALSAANPLHWFRHAECTLCTQQRPGRSNGCHCHAFDYCTFVSNE